MLNVFCVKGERGMSFIVIKPQKAEKAYDIATEIFIDYYKKITKKEAKSVVWDDGTSDLVIIGSDAVNDFLVQEMFKGIVKPLSIRYGTDDYCYFTYKKDNRNVLVFAGGRGRSTLYAVYDYFERYCGCGYFWDGDVIPECEDIPLDIIYVTEKPRFEYRGLRYFAHRGLKRFQAEHWSFEDWKKEIDYIVKKRLNFFMLRIGMDDVWQRAFPSEVHYPDGFVTEPYTGYVDRSDFWTLKYRGELRERIMQYSRDCDLFTATDCGTMTHWYSPTPEEFLQKQKVDFLEQADHQYNELDSGKVFDFRIQQNMDYYMRLTKTMAEQYDKNNYLFHTIGLGERRIFKENEKNFLLKKLCYRKITQNLRYEYPDSKLLVASWDFVGWWRPEDVCELIKELDPERTIILDYTSDGIDELQNFTNWGVVGKFPWIFGIFHAYESESELRGVYDLIQKRLKIASEDPYCKGMILWPELSHSDPLVLEYLSANAWTPLKYDISATAKYFCEKRYSSSFSKCMDDCWQKFLPFMQLASWGGYTRVKTQDGSFKTDSFWNTHSDIWVKPVSCLSDANQQLVTDFYKDKIEKSKAFIPSLVEICDSFAEIITETENEFIKRDVIDIARTICGRFLNYILASAVYFADTMKKIDVLANLYSALISLLADLLSFNDEFSLYSTLEYLKNSAPTNPNFEKTLKENILNDYCRQYCTELVDFVFEPEADALFEQLKTGSFKNTEEEKHELVKQSDAIMEAFRKKPLKDCKHISKQNLSDTLKDISKELFKLCSAL